MSCAFLKLDKVHGDYKLSAYPSIISLASSRRSASAFALASSGFGAGALESVDSFWESRCLVVDGRGSSAIIDLVSLIIDHDELTYALRSVYKTLVKLSKKYAKFKVTSVKRVTLIRKAHRGIINELSELLLAAAPALV